MITTLVFSYDSHPLSWLVQRRTGCLYAHVAIELPDGRLVEAMPGRGVIVSPQPDYGTNRYLRQIVDIPDGWQYALTQVGKPYDYVAVAALSCPFPIQRNWMDSERWFCSELALASLMHAGLKGGEGVWGITPRDLYFIALFR